MALNNGNHAATSDLESGAPLEKDFSPVNGGRYSPNMDANVDHGAALQKIRTAETISMSPELFEKLYLSPPNKVHGHLRTTVGNPTPLALIGFVMSLTPLSMDLLKWQGTNGTGSAGTGFLLFFGGLLMTLGAVGEWIIGNTFPCVVFGTFAAFWLGFSTTLQPFYNAFGAYSPDPSNPAEGLATVGFRSGFAFFFIAMAIFCFICMICSLRTNLVFFMIFFILVIAFPILASAYFQLNNGNVALAGRLQEAGAALLFACVLFGWYMFFAIMLASLDFPWSLPVGDLSSIIKGASERKKAE